LPVGDSQMGASTRLLVMAGAAVAGVEQVPPLIQVLIREAAEILVIAPALPGRLQWLSSDSDRVRYEADERLRTVIEQIETLAPGAAKTGDVGDDTPYSAFIDAVRRFEPDHILIAMRSADHSAWQERRLTDRVRTAFHVPFTVFEIDRRGRVSAASPRPTS
jgi:hypothetical protein